jgi:hypothetical protein
MPNKELHLTVVLAVKCSARSVGFEILQVYIVKLQLYIAAL